MKKPITPTQKMLNTWAIVVILWSVYRTSFGTDLPVWFDEFIAKPLIFLFPVVYYIQNFEKKEVLSALDLKFKGSKGDLLIGLVAGLLFIGSGLAVFIMKNMTLPTIFTHFSIATALQIVCVSFASSISEELLSRGFVLKRLYDDSKKTFLSVLYASLLFFVLHIPILFSNADIRGNILLQVMVTDILLSFAVSYIYLQRKNVLVAIIIHAFYNLSIYLLV